MNLPSRYFENAHEAVNEEFLGFDDFDGDDLPMDDYDDFDDEFDGFDADQLPATGGRPSAPTSQPYIIEIANTTTASISNVVILDSAQRQQNYAVAGVSITYGLSNITYQQFLSSISSGRTFKCGIMRLVASNASSSVSESQVLTTTTIETKDINGNAIVKPYVPQRDPYQQINNQVDINYPFLVDDLTKITFDTLYGSTTLKIYLYPAAKVNPFKGLKNRRNSSGYKNPGIAPLLRKGK